RPTPTCSPTSRTARGRGAIASCRATRAGAAGNSRTRSPRARGSPSPPIPRSSSTTTTRPSGPAPPPAAARPSSAPSVGRGGGAGDREVEDGGQPGGDGAVERGAEVRRRRHVLAVGAEGGGHPVVARRGELAADRPVGAVVLQLELVLRVPARVVADHHHHRQP